MPATPSPVCTVIFCCCSNCLTGERVDQQDMRVYQWAVNNIGLTDQQKQHMAEVAPIFRCLQQSVLDELQQLQLQPGEVEDQHSAAEVQLPIGMLHRPTTTELQREHSEQRAKRLRVLLRKQHCVGVVYNAYLLGLMSYLNLARLGAATFPFPSFLFLLAAEVEKAVARDRGQ